MYKYLSVVSLVLLAACGGSEVGNQVDEDPIAQAGVFGSSLNTSDTVAVRSGSDVLLSGQNSEGVDDPILEFNWKQIDESGYEVALFERTSSSVVFTAPDIPLNEREGVELEFELNIQDADGREASDTVKVNILPAADQNHFLSRPRVIETYAIIVVPAEGESLASEVPITLTLNESVEWTDRAGNLRTQAISEKTIQGTVPEGTVSDISDKGNRYFIENIPMLDADEVNKYFQESLRDGRLEFELVEDAEHIIDISLAQQNTGNLRIYLARNGELGLELLDLEDVQPSQNRLRFTGEWLRQQINIESRLSANNYYKCIDPFDEAVTLSSWLNQAGFYDDGVEIHHSTYVNNYDLNFGRDMYVRTDEFGNVFSYVVNYPTLENALTGRNDFAVVVMEFSAAPTGQCGDGTFVAEDGKKIVKFYAYVPDETTGEFVRAPTMNFDGRGERSLPGVCIACHFGDANADAFNVADYTRVDAAAADLESSFMLWDLDAFLYTDGDVRTDPVYTANEISSEITAVYSREAQEDAFRAQNQAVLHTFTYDINQLYRFETAIKLLHGLYQNEDAVNDLNFGTAEAPLSESELVALQAAVSELPDNDFDGENYTQPGWVGEEALYHKVFARNCRLCHAQIGERAIDFDSYEELITNERLVPYVYEQGLMPLSRLTMDRFWADYFGEQSAAEFLRDHLNSDADTSNDVGLDLVPGAPVAIVLPEENTETAADVLLNFNEQELFDGTSSLFSDSYQWRLNGRLVSTDSKYVFEATTPGETAELEFLATKSGSFITSESLTRTVLVVDNTPTIDTVPSQSIVEGEQLGINIFDLLCPGESADSEQCRSVFGDITEGDTPTISIIGEATNGTVDSVDSESGRVQFSSTAAEAAGDAGFDFTLTDSFGEASRILSLVVNVNSQSGPQIGGPDSCDIEARSFANEDSFPISFNSVLCPDPSLNDTVADGLNLSLVSVDGSSLQSGGSVTINNGVIEYQPARFFLGPDSFEYAVQDDSLSAKTSSGTVLVNIEAQQTYSSLSTGSGLFAATGSDGCADCHTGLLAGAPSWLNVANVQLAAINRTENYGESELTLAEPTTTEELLDSILFKKACNHDGSHLGGNRLCTSVGAPTDVSDLNTLGRNVLQWIEEGARDN